MASGEGYNSLKENKDGSNDSNSISGSSSSYLTASGCSADYFTASCSSEDKSSPAVLDPASRSDGRPKKFSRRRFLLFSPPSTSAQEVAVTSSGDSYGYENEQQKSGEHRNGNEQEASTSSSGDSHSHGDEPLINGENRGNNQQQANETRTNCCAPSQLMECYLNCVHKIGGSCVIHIFQFLVFSMCASSIVMGIVFFRSCEGKYPSTNPFLGILMGIFGLFLTYMWVAKVCRERRGERFWNHDKNRLIMFLLVVLFFMVLEFLFSTRITPTTLPEATEVKCTQTYYDYLYYMHIVNGGFLVLAALLYLPDFLIYICNCRRMVPTHHNGHYQPL